jgi:hypothetical protein
MGAYRLNRLRVKSVIELLQTPKQILDFMEGMEFLVQVSDYHHINNADSCS